MKRTKAPMPNNIDRMERAGTRPHALHKPNKDAKKYGYPRWLRSYCKRYGYGIDAMVREDIKNNVITARDPN